MTTTLAAASMPDRSWIERCRPSSPLHTRSSRDLSCVALSLPLLIGVRSFAAYLLSSAILALNPAISASRCSGVMAATRSSSDWRREAWLAASARACSLTVILLSLLFVSMTELYSVMLHTSTTVRRLVAA